MCFGYSWILNTISVVRMTDDVVITSASYRSGALLTFTTQHQDRMAMDYEMMIRLERLRVQEALNARDVAVDRLASACASVREKTNAVDSLREEKERLQDQLNGLGSKDHGEVDKENRSVSIKTTEREGRVVPEPMKSMEDRFALLQVDDVGLGGWSGGMAFNLKVRHTYCVFSGC